jgi:hypothetical protein
VLGLDTLELDSDFLSGYDVGSKIDVAEGAGTDFPTDSILVTDAKILRETRTLAHWTSRAARIDKLIDTAYSVMYERAS